MNRIRQAWVASGVCAVACAGALGEDRGFDRLDGFADLRARWVRAAEDLRVPGFAIALVRDGEIAAIEGFGVRDTSPGAPVDPDTMFYIASCTKTYLAAGALVLVDQGKLGLDDPVRAHIPEFRLADERAAATITVRDLLSHRRGLNCSAGVVLDAYTGEITDERFFHWLAKETPSEQVRYTNTHFTLAGRVIERITGRSWRDFLDEAVFTPAGMDRTTGYASVMYGDPNAAWPMEWTPQGFRRADQIKSDATMHAAGGMGTSARDAARWVMVHLGSGALGDTRMLSARNAREMLTPQSRFPQTRGSIRAMEGFGLGWQMGTYRGLTPYVAHGGGYIGTAAHLSFLPEKGVGVVVLANSSPGGSALGDIVSIDIYDAILGVEDEDLLPLYIKDIAAHHDRRAAEAPADARARAGDLVHPIAAHTGTYGHPHLGTIVVWSDDDTVKARMGTMAIDLFPTAQPGVLRGVSAMGPIESISFEFDADGRARAVEFIADDEPMRFERRAGS